MPLVSCLLLMIMVLQVMIMEAVVLVVGWSPPFNIVLTSLIWSMLWHAKGFTYFQAFCGLNCFWTSSHNSPEHFGLVAKEINLPRILVFANGFTVILIILCNAANQWQEKNLFRSFFLYFAQPVNCYGSWAEWAQVADTLAKYYKVKILNRFCISFPANFNLDASNTFKKAGSGACFPMSCINTPSNNWLWVFG